MIKHQNTQFSQCGALVIFLDYGTWDSLVMLEWLGATRWFNHGTKFDRGGPVPRNAGSPWRQSAANPGRRCRFWPVRTSARAYGTWPPASGPALHFNRCRPPANPLDQEREAAGVRPAVFVLSRPAIQYRPVQHPASLQWVRCCDG